MGGFEVDPVAIGGGLSILTAMVLVFRLVFSRLNRQDDIWLQLLDAAERRAVAAESTLTQVRRVAFDASVVAEQYRKDSTEEIKQLKEQLEKAQLQINELQRWDGDKNA